MRLFQSFKGGWHYAVSDGDLERLRGIRAECLGNPERDRDYLAGFCRLMTDKTER